MSHSLAELLLDWYRLHARQLPWRQRKDAYGIWVAEVMLQQTRVDTVIPYYHRWMERFPDVLALANAGLEEVLAAWEGLGYYQRAHNLWRAARIVRDQYGGVLPADVRAWRALPGVGSYTAGAIVSIAFGLDEPALDGNIRRVLARVFDIRLPVRSPQARRRFWDLARQHLPGGQAGAYNQALMDLGATVCTPRRPDCANCPLAGICQAYILGVQEALPIRTQRARIPHETVTAAVIWRNGRVLITRRPLHGLLGGLWEFPGGKVEPGEDLDSCLRREINEELGVQVNVGELVGVYRHAYTHFRVTLHAFSCSLPDGSEPSPLQVSDYRWVRPLELGDYPMSKIDRRIAAQIMGEKPLG